MVFLRAKIHSNQGIPQRVAENPFGGPCLSHAAFASRSGNAPLVCCGPGDAPGTCRGMQEQVARGKGMVLTPEGETSSRRLAGVLMIHGKRNERNRHHLT